MDEKLEFILKWGNKQELVEIIRVLDTRVELMEKLINSQNLLIESKDVLISIKEERIQNFKKYTGI